MGGVTALELAPAAWPLVTDEGGGRVFGHRDTDCDRASRGAVVVVSDPFDAWPCPGCVPINGGRLDPATNAGKAAAHDLARSYKGHRPYMVAMREKARGDLLWWPTTEQARAILTTRHLP